jgi:hypothetical protein
MSLRRWGATGAALAALAVIACALVLTGFSGWSLVPASYLALFAAMIGGGLGVALGKAVAPRLQAVRRRRAAGLVPEQSIASAGPGPVRLQGVARVVHAALSPSGQRCVAYASRVNRQGSDLELDAAAGTFVLEDGSGARALVSSRNVVIVGGVPGRHELMIPDGARVRVVGEARWRVATAEDAGGGLRSAAQSLEVTGTAEAPLVLELLDESVDGSTRVRVAPDAAVEDRWAGVADLSETTGAGGVAEQRAGERVGAVSATAEESSPSPGAHSHRR